MRERLNCSLMARLPLLEMDDIPEEYHYLFTEDYLGDRNIFREWAHNPEVLEATLKYLNTLYDQFTPREKELVILTVARARRAEYEWHQHVDISRGAGVSGDEIRAIGGDDFSSFNHAESVLLQYARAEEQSAVTDQIHDAVAAEFSDGEIVALGLIVDFYTGLLNYVEAADLPFEGGEFIGWTPDDERIEKLFE